VEAEKSKKERAAGSLECASPHWTVLSISMENPTGAPRPDDRVDNQEFEYKWVFTHSFQSGSKKISHTHHEKEDCEQNHQRGRGQHAPEAITKCGCNAHLISRRQVRSTERGSRLPVYAAAVKHTNVGLSHVVSALGDKSYHRSAGCCVPASACQRPEYNRGLVMRRRYEKQALAETEARTWQFG